VSESESERARERERERERAYETRAGERVSGGGGGREAEGLYRVVWASRIASRRARGPKKKMEKSVHTSRWGMTRVCQIGNIGI
jgi:hypothetical protein